MFATINVKSESLLWLRASKIEIQVVASKSTLFDTNKSN